MTTAWCDCPGAEHEQGRDHYRERVDRGECAWCEKPYDRTVCFEACEHATPCCSDHFNEYFEFVGWEWMLEGENTAGPTCPECFG